MIEKLRQRSNYLWLRDGIVVIFILSLVIRFWGLGRFNKLVFDEVYYAKFANDYLTNTYFYNAHPPLSQYIIAIGIWIGDQLSIGRDNVNNLTGSIRSTFSYRWFDAIFGACIPLAVAGIAYQLTNKISYAFLGALFISIDGLFLVDSRYALNNVFLILFGLLGQLLFLTAIKYRNHNQWLLLIASGTFLDFQLLVNGMVCGFY